jgi:hypothetical protein
VLSASARRVGALVAAGDSVTVRCSALRWVWFAFSGSLWDWPLVVLHSLQGLR